MQKRQATNSSAYTLAGDALHPFERIVVSRSVELPAEEGTQEERQTFRAPRAEKEKSLNLSLPMTALMIVAVIAIMSMFSAHKAEAARRLQSDVESIKNKYVAAEAERQDLQAAFAKACDSSYISYYAAQTLGMKRAVFEETIHVMAGNTRLDTQYATGLFGGLASGNSNPNR